MVGAGVHRGRIAAVPELVVLAEQLLAPVPGGTGRYTAELLRALAATVPDGWSLAGAVARHSDIEPARVAGVRGPRRLALPPRALAAAWQAGMPLWPGGDAVHAPTPLAPPRTGRARTLSVTVHDTVPWTHPETLTRRGVSWHRAMIARAAARADAVVVPTQAVAADLATRVAVRTDVHVIGHGPTTWPSGNLQELPDRYVLAVGTLEPRKGIDVLIAAMAELGEPVPLVLAGRPRSGGLDPARLAREHGLPEGQVRMLGGLDDAALVSALRGASVLAAPSRAEGFGLPVLEAMAAGVPVVHSDDPALVEVAGGAGYVVRRDDAAALADALRVVLDSPLLAGRMAAAGRVRAAAFSWQRAAEEVWSLHAGIHGNVSVDPVHPPHGES
jgi:glycosyltransferase involved in cell wall biosynthesis